MGDPNIGQTQDELRRGRDQWYVNALMCGVFGVASCIWIAESTMQVVAMATLSILATLGCVSAALEKDARRLYRALQGGS